MKVKFTVIAKRWFDKVNGNTYHSVRVINNETGKVLTAPLRYGFGEHYRQTALQIMFNAGWIPEKYGIKNSNGSDNLYLYERENAYPIYWEVTDGLKRDCIANGKAV